MPKKMNNKNCNHKGKWKRVGASMLSEDLGEWQYSWGIYTKYIVSIFCEDCGEIKTEINTKKDFFKFKVDV